MGLVRWRLNPQISPAPNRRYDFDIVGFIAPIWSTKAAAPTRYLLDWTKLKAGRDR